MAQQASGYWSRMWAALCGRSAAGTDGAEGNAVSLQSSVGNLELELRERDAKIEQMKHEYAVLQAARERDVSGAGLGELERMFKKLAGPLSNLMVLTDMAERGEAVAVHDLVQLIRSVEKALARFGLEPIGRAGEPAPFDVAQHQRMSGGAVHDGTQVTVRVPGYRHGDTVLLKAMVSAEEED